MFVKSLLAGAVALVLSAPSCERTVTRLQLAPAPAQKCEPPRIVLVKPGMPANVTYQSNSMPPQRFQGDKRITVHFTTPEGVTKHCNGGKPICGFRIMACQKGNELILPNPCRYGMESYGRLSCHEVAHANGWPAYHGD
jgi:hypothetical protein